MELNVKIKEEYYIIEECWENINALQNVEIKQEDNDNIAMCANINISQIDKLELQEVDFVKIETNTDEQNLDEGNHFNNFKNNVEEKEDMYIKSEGSTDDEYLDEETCLDNFMNTDITIEDEIKEEESESYKCTICNKAFTLKSHLKEHLIVHSGIRSFKCTTCDKAFANRSNLKQHSLLHSGDKHFKCITYDKGFTDKSNLNRNFQMQMSNLKSYRRCFVPLCKNTTKTTPNKMFLNVPHDEKRRSKWFQVVQRDNPKSKSNFFCCEDHFDLKDDMENYMYYTTMGGNAKIKIDVVPHKFDCQPDRKRQSTEEAILSPTAEKRSRQQTINEISTQSENVENNADQEQNIDNESSNTVKTELDTPNMTPNQKSKNP